MRPGVAFPHRHPHELPHLRPLMDRLQDLLVAPPARARVAVHASGASPVRGAWNVQLFHGMGDRGLAALFPRRGGRLPRRPSLRRRHQQANAYGPRWADLLEETQKGVEVSRFGHPAINDLDGLEADPEGPVLWLPGGGRRRILGGPRASGLPTMAVAAMALAGQVPLLIKPHPPEGRHGPSRALLRRLAATPGVTVAPPHADPYVLMHGCRGVLADAGSMGLGLEAHCAGLPVAVARNPGVPLLGPCGEFAMRVPAVGPDATLDSWAEAPEPPRDPRWGRDLLFAPDPRRNDAFAASLRARAVPGGSA